ncbi:hypothetical protein [Paracidovorax wautersii]|uniref:Uncharacterized protein n=1 Tax=Paracidovorax wautersii TaxID=1177982 RepID=A0A1I2B523_9BURK|nr:hypothetical protein [Paracidovorax wautersii]SFE51176.1 hypothetical protein SAMN04489711_102417 [Paracidovorax wautersii]
MEFGLFFSMKARPWLIDKIQNLTSQHYRMPKTTVPPRKAPSRQAVLRSVASSTAVETGHSVVLLERRLQQPVVRFPRVKLAR